MPKASASAVAQSMPSPVSIIVFAAIEKALNRAVDVETLRHVGEPRADRLECFEIDAGLAAPLVLGDC